jgi:hypothetical protein
MGFGAICNAAAFAQSAPSKPRVFGALFFGPTRPGLEPDDDGGEDCKNGEHDVGHDFLVASDTNVLP